MTRGWIVSIGLHAGILAAALLGPHAKPFEWDPDKPLAVELVASAVEPPAPKPPAPRPVPEEPPKEAPVKETVPESTPSPEPPKPEPTPVRPQPRKVRPPRQFQHVAPERPDEGPTLEERLTQRLQQVDEQVAIEEEPPAPPPETAPTQGPAATAEVEALDFPFAWYLRQVQTRVRDAWDTPGGRLLAGGTRPVGVVLVIHRDGHVTDARVESSSGTPGLDASAIRAVQRAQPFPPLPDPYEGDELSLTIRFRVSGDER